MRSAIYHRQGVQTIAVALLLAASTPASAAPSPPPPVLVEAWVTVSGPSDLADLERVGLTVSEGRRVLPDGRVEQRVIAPRSALGALRGQGREVRITRDDHRLGPPRSGYHDPTTGDDALAALADRSDRAGLVQVGTSLEGRPITGLWLGRPPAAGAPTWRVLGAHHGDEWSSFEVALDVASTLVDADGAEAGVTELLDTSTVWFVPFVNPDGVARGSRYNAAGVDLNRNYGYAWSADTFKGGPHPFSEPETRAIRALGTWHPAIAGLTLHSGAVNIGYPWNHTTTPTPEEPALDELAWLYADECTAPGFWVTNGADWYITRGDTTDWSYGRHGTWDYTLEVTSTKAPAASTIPTYTDWHRDAVVATLLEPPTLSGRVFDAETGDPVPAAMRWIPSDTERAVPFATHPVTGSFHRLTAPVRGTVEVVAPGWSPAAIQVTADTAAALDLQIALSADRLGDDMPVPRLLGDGPTTVRLPVQTPRVHLIRPGHRPRALEADGDRVTVDPAGLAPGPWTLMAEDGTAWPRSLFVPDPGPARLYTADLEGAGIVLRGERFGRGTRAWALWGPRRVPVPVRVMHETSEQIVMDPSGLPAGANLDLAVLSNGTQLAVLDVMTPASPGESPEVVLERGTCGCAAAPRSLPTAILLLIPLAWRRRS